MPADHEPTLVMRVNGADREITVDPRATLVGTLHEQLGLTGTKKGCDRGECGACTVLLTTGGCWAA